MMSLRALGRHIIHVVIQKLLSLLLKVLHDRWMNIISINRYNYSK